MLVHDIEYESIEELRPIESNASLFTYNDHVDGDPSKDIGMKSSSRIDDLARNTLLSSERG